MFFMNTDADYQFGYRFHQVFYGTITMDETRIYNRALTSTEIATMYANQSSPASFWTTGAEVQGANPAWNYLQGS